MYGSWIWNAIEADRDLRRNSRLGAINPMLFFCPFSGSYSVRSVAGFIPEGAWNFRAGNFSQPLVSLHSH